MKSSYGLRGYGVIVGILALAFFSGLIIFYGTTIPVVYGAVARGKRYATFPVLGGLVGLCFCGLGFVWNCAPQWRNSIIPFFVLSTIGIAPLVTCFCLLFASEPLLVKVRNSAAISAASALGIGLCWLIHTARVAAGDGSWFGWLGAI